MRSPRTLFLLIILTISLYAPVLALPLIGANFIEIPVARVLGSWHALPVLLANANWHFRLTDVFLTSVIVQRFGLQPRPFYIASLVLLALSVVVCYFTGKSKLLLPNAAIWAAGFFAIFEGHHAAVLLSNWPDLLATFFTFLALLGVFLWMPGRNPIAYLLTLLAFFGACISHEAGCLGIVLLSGVYLSECDNTNRVSLSRLLPFLVIAVTAAGILLTHPPRPVAWSVVLRTLDPWWITALWTFAALLALFLLRNRRLLRFEAICAAYTALVLLVGAALAAFTGAPIPVSCLASIGTALLVGQAIAFVQSRFSWRPLLAVIVVILTVNVTLLWSIRSRQLTNLAAPTQALLNAAMYAQGPIRLDCFPFPAEIAQAVAGLAGTTATFEKSARSHEENCTSFSYRDSTGAVRQVYMRPRF